MKINRSLVLFDLPVLIEKMKHEKSFVRGKLNVRVLLKNADKQIVLTTLVDGTEINSFQSFDSVTFQIIEGKLIFHTHNESVILEKGQLLTLYENIGYTLTTQEETVLLLTIIKGLPKPGIN